MRSSIVYFCVFFACFWITLIARMGHSTVKIYGGFRQQFEAISDISKSSQSLSPQGLSVRQGSTSEEAPRLTANVASPSPPVERQVDGGAPSAPGGVGGARAAGDVKTNIMFVDKEVMDRFWGGGHSERMTAAANGECGDVCKFSYSREGSEYFDVLVLVAGHSGREATFRHKMESIEQAQKRKTLKAVVLTEADDDLFRVRNYMRHYDVRISYSFDADIKTFQSCGTVNEMVERRVSGRAFLNQTFLRPGSIVGMISNCGSSYRQQYIAELMKHIKIDQYGTCFNNKQLESHQRRGSSQWHTEKEKVLSQYKVSLAMENTIKSDYVTEKVYNALAVGSLPVYHGTQDVIKYVPSNSIIHAGNFTPVKLAEHLSKVLEDQTLFESYFQWTEEDVRMLQRKLHCNRSWYCRVCDLARERLKPNGRRRF
mmetsp:Transcript_47142/g.147534  ORF Transcript_47142/g.147534 Transcript_47142/m.147534 type:complete len:427 (-) Transcript_47142:27-1307(-)